MDRVAPTERTKKHQRVRVRLAGLLRAHRMYARASLADRARSACLWFPKTFFVLCALGAIIWVVARITGDRAPFLMAGVLPGCMYVSVLSERLKLSIVSVFIWHQLLLFSAFGISGILAMTIGLESFDESVIEALAFLAVLAGTIEFAVTFGDVPGARLRPGEIERLRERLLALESGQPESAF